MQDMLDGKHQEKVQPEFADRVFCSEKCKHENMQIVSQLKAGQDVSPFAV
jgi:hypothetical protein